MWETSCGKGNLVALPSDLASGYMPMMLQMSLRAYKSKKKNWQKRLT